MDARWAAKAEGWAPRSAPRCPTGEGSGVGVGGQPLSPPRAVPHGDLPAQVGLRLPPAAGGGPLLPNLPTLRFFGVAFRGCTPPPRMVRGVPRGNEGRRNLSVALPR